jgi:putative membrane protein
MRTATSWVIGALAMLTAPVGFAADHTAAEDAFVRNAERVGHLEIADARAALRMSSNPDVRKAAEVERRDIARIDLKLSAIAVQKGWSVPADERAGGAIGVNDYSDRNYVTDQIASAQRAILLFREEAQNGADQDLQDFARQSLPNLEACLDTFRSLQDS